MNKGSLGHSFEVLIITENQNQVSIYPYVQYEISGLTELSFGHLCCLLTDVPPQPYSPTNNVFNLNLEAKFFKEVLEDIQKKSFFTSFFLLK